MYLIIRVAAGALLASMAVAAAAAPAITVVPATPLEHQSLAGRTLNFDFRIANPDAQPLELAQLRLIVTDSSGAVLSDAIINQNGTAPSILTIPNRAIAAGASVTVFNPFPLLPAGITGDVKLKYLWSFTAGDEKTIDATTEVTPVAYRQKTKLRFPLAGRVLVWDGHDFLSHHRRLDFDHPFLKEMGVRANSGRYAYDFTLIDAQGQRVKADGKRNEDNYSYDQPIHAPADGTIAVARDGMDEKLELGLDEIRKDLSSIYGNTVVIDHGNGEFSRFGHLKTGTVAVQVGERVRAGQVIGHVGNSGSSLFPHLHYELLSGPLMSDEGLPSTFVDLYRVLGTVRVKLTVSPDTGQIIEAGK